jgi:glycosyltransferase 2 family protein
VNPKLKRALLRLPRSNATRLAITIIIAGLVAVLLWWRGPSFSAIADAFTVVRWQWVVVAVGLNLASVVARAAAWDTVIRQAIPAPYPSNTLVFSAFSVGLFANAVLPGRIGELARVAVLTRRLPRRRGLWATLVGTVFAHRVFDFVPVGLLILYVAFTAKIPSWAVTSLILFVAIGVLLFTFAFVSARRPNAPAHKLDSLGAVRHLLSMARQGLSVLRSPVWAGVAILFQIAGWICQLLAVWTAMRAFDIHAPLPAAAVVLLLMNVATIFPLWPGNVGLTQVAIATPLKSYGVAYAHGVAFGFGLQAIEASVGIGVGLIFLAREGLSFAMLSVMPSADQAEMADNETDADSDAEVTRNAKSARTRVPG